MTIKPTEREQWRARILRALAELDTDPPGLERRRDGSPEQDHGPTTKRFD